jgi:ribosomal protein S18 acetylase RimI-like enzyme
METAPAHFTDLPEILALQKAAFYTVAVAQNHFMIRPLHTTLAEIEENFPKYLYLKLSENSRILAAGRARMDGTVCKLENIIVRPDRHRKGLGRKIVTALEEQFTDCSCYELFTGKETPGNRQFYESLGYRVTGEIPATDSEPVLITMRKPGPALV